ncbi:hypothetical protein [Tuwongella immobilis]|uniref:Carboxypeptidase regulatory-like domain-containing protein n=1 Tax=Tuwongella immobilis TaxID=692036 RepID=A0A6C2YVY5_9BACT|nr:hypothetical protein [Tuwongella immobilis]VIP05676.1 Uncharacterized protein OS=Blastopirellula marina DSM 3645 GN=DSM3645_29326 PE=4 SV=1 [Tuwongella immobilis]VTS08708.1 Uncharacterized protein OS=Blastopirellula marina DSM 3645 GN=DSM3645_29326 PE=4 SV=1 [Tuwongella immobilis]
MPLRTRRRLTLLVWPMLALAGCGESNTERVTVHGQVTIQGQPLIGGTIVFTPDPERGQSGPLSFAPIQSDGTYILRTEQGFGAPPGWHRITIAPAPTVDANTPALLPSRYRHPEQSGLVRQVQATGENQIDFQLQEQ